LIGIDSVGELIQPSESNSRRVWFIWLSAKLVPAVHPCR